MRVQKICLALSAISGFLAQAPALTASPLVSVGDIADIYFNGSSSLRWTSNIFRENDDENEDLIWTLSPGFEINFGRGVSNGDFSIITRYDLIRYEDLSRLNTELFHIRAFGTYNTSRLELSGSASFDEEQSTAGDLSAASDIDDLIEIDRTAARFDAEYQFSPKLSFGSGISYTEREYETFEDRFADTEQYSIPFNIFYELTPKVDLSLGYTYTETEVDATSVANASGAPGVAYDRESHFFNVGARGVLLPKVTGFFRIGYRTQENDLPNSDEDGILGLNADFTWTATPKVTTTLGLGRDFGVAGEGQNTEDTRIRLATVYTFAPQYSLRGFVNYTLRDFINTDREDDIYSAGARLTFVPNQHWRFSTGYTYTTNESDLETRDYDSHTVDLTASLRY